MLTKDTPKKEDNKNWNVSYDPSYILEVLKNIGFKEIATVGDYFRTRAVYRNGNSLSLSIHKKSGNWLDFKTKQRGTLKDIPALFGGKGTITIKDGEVVKQSKPEIEQQDKFWEPSIIDGLLPIYDFYNKKKITNKTLRLFKGGFAKRGDFYNRFVFPIFHKNTKIHGFAGRDTTDKSQIKWKINGKKTSFLYPFYTVKESQERIKEIKSINIVESVGDCLTMWENDVKNSLVLFGAEIFQPQINLLVSLDLDSINICLNDDSSSKDKTGNKGAIKTFIKLSSFFSTDKLRIKFPVKNDFGEMDAADFAAWEVQPDKTKELVISSINNKIDKGWNVTNKELSLLQIL